MLIPLQMAVDMCLILSTQFGNLRAKNVNFLFERSERCLVVFFISFLARLGLVESGLKG
jgi:hypothetical protein